RWGGRPAGTPSHWSSEASAPAVAVRYTLPRKYGPVAGWVLVRGSPMVALASVSATPQPQWPGSVLVGSLGQPSTQSAAPSESASVSAIPHPQAPGSVFLGSVGQPSTQLGAPSASSSVSGTPQPQRPGSVFIGSSGQRSHE